MINNKYAHTEKKFWFKILFALETIFIGFGGIALAADNFGFVRTSLWYSKEPFFVGETIRIYTALFNSGADDVVGSVAFFVDNGRIATTSFSLPKGSSQVLWGDWKAIAGTHKFFARIAEVKRAAIGRPLELLDVVNAETGFLETFVDEDTDNDKSGNAKDEDDDNDGLLDTKEAELGTNPKKSDSDGDGIGDKKDEKPLEKALSYDNVPSSAAKLAVQASQTVPNLFQSDKQVAQSAGKLFREGIIIADEIVNRIERGVNDKRAIMHEKQNVAPILEIARNIIAKENKSSDKRRDALSGGSLFASLYLGGLDVLSFILKYKLIFYSIAAYLLYRVLKFSIRKLFRRAMGR